MSSTLHHRARVRARRWPLVLAMLFSIALAPVVARSQLRLTFPDPDPGGPVYARVERPFLVHTDTHAAIVFYREPSCVPEDFDLLDNVDLEGFPFDARAFRCPMTVEGTQIWTTFQFPDPPNLVFTRGTGAVPVWFVAWPELQAALADDRLTIVELRGMSSLQIGAAFHFQETLQLSPEATTRRLEFIALGTMTDGRQFHVGYAFKDGRLAEIQIRFR